ncbi:SPRY [Musa troglodytarum]|uniref:SPRY n=1 Tax=Musa troglodytarum TaxID=320322 RepID=A0A9E7HXB5_9LILI|nr:SPRY [Musa troglodytarum]
MINQEPAGESIDLFRLASRWRSGAEWKKIVEEMDSEPVPSHLNTINSSGLFQIVSTDKMSVQYVGTPQHGHDVGVVQADCPAPTRRLAYYFEMTVKNAGQKGQVAIGFTMQHFKMRRQPGAELSCVLNITMMTYYVNTMGGGGGGGVLSFQVPSTMVERKVFPVPGPWEANSCGYHGDDGYLYRGQGKGESFGPTFTTNDTVGAGINYASQEFFFTKNAKLVGTVPKDIKGPLYPSIAVHSQNEEYAVGFILEERLKQQAMIEKLSLQPNISHWVCPPTRKDFARLMISDFLKIVFGLKNCLNPSHHGFLLDVQPNKIVRSYLLHYGYQDTLKSFDLASENTYPSESMAQENGFDDQGDMYALDHRNILRQLIKNGNIDSAFQKLREWYPQVLQVGQLAEAVSYAQSELQKFFSVKSYVDLLQDVSGLLAYKVPVESSVGYLLDGPQREFVADAVNAVVLSTNPNLKDPDRCLYSCLEKLLRQLTLCSLERRASSEDQGEAFCLHRELQSGGRAKFLNRNYGSVLLKKLKHVSSKTSRNDVSDGRIAAHAREPKSDTRPIHVSD